MKKVQKLKFVYCPKCGDGQYAIPGFNEEVGKVTCKSCGEIFDSSKEIKEPQ